jgi:phospholipase C
MSQPHRRPSRRTFLGGVGAGAAAVGLLALLPGDSADVVAAAKGRGRLDDVEHVVILMQENRSFDHYFGTMRGVRGFGDPTRLTLPSGRDVLHQPDDNRVDGGFLLPFRVDTAKVDGQDLGDLAHDWNSTHQAWNSGRYDQWVTAKTDMAMSYFTAADIPFQRALAEAFTICDAYFCSQLGPTTPNRLFLWTGTIDPGGAGGGPVTANPPDYQPVFSWTTYPERLQQAGISWQVFANDEVGDIGGSYVGDYGDNPLWLFQAYHDALASTDPKVHQLAERASLRAVWKPDSGLGPNVDHVLADWQAACASGTLPAVSWIVAPYAYCEHPAARPVDGAAYVQAVLTALWKKPELWAKTVVFLNYDENDGFYDHVAPPVPPAGTADEFLPARQPAFPGHASPPGMLVPIGLGPRVPMTVISPWSHGGWVNSQVYDHTSVLRFLEAWTGVREPNISAWRRQICGDLTGCFDFTRPTSTRPKLPDAAALRVAADRSQSKLPTPAPPPPGMQTVPVQDAGRAPSRPLPYQPLANFTVAESTIQVRLTNLGSATFPFALSADAEVTPFDVPGAGAVTTSIALTSNDYLVQVHGPNGFLALAAATSGAPVEVALAIVGPATHPLLQTTMVNNGPTAEVAQLSAVDTATATITLAAGAHHQTILDPVGGHDGWYDLSVAISSDAGYLRRFAGHLETGRPSTTR